MCSSTSPTVPKFDDIDIYRHNGTDLGCSGGHGARFFASPANSHLGFIITDVVV